MKEYRCIKCNKLLFKGEPNNVEIKCPRCGTMINFDKSLRPSEAHKPKGGLKDERRKDLHPSRHDGICS